MHWIALQPSHKPLVPVAGADAAVLVDADTALAWWALRFTPLVARMDTSLVLEVSQSERLFGGRAALLQQLLESEACVMLDHAQGATALLALARLWARAPDAPIHSLPLHTLAAAREHLPTLQRLGCNTWGQLRALPRGGLVRRFGAGLVDALDCAYGQRPEVYPWLTLPDVFAQRLELSAAVESASALLFGARRLLAQLLVWLRARQRGVQELELLWELDARRSNAQHIDAYHDGSSQGRMLVRTAEPTQDMQHLQRLLGEQLAQVTLPAPVLYLHLRTVQTQALHGESHSLLPEDVRKGDSLHQMLERLGARLGREQVTCVQQQERHCPEHMQVWAPWSSASGKPSSAPTCVRANATHGAAQMGGDAGLDNALLPTWLLPVPLPLGVKQQCPQYHGPLILLAGPQRIEAGWLEDNSIALRDYFVARSEHAGLVWIYRERLGRTHAHKKTSAEPGLRWFLHGLFA
ncbi:DNA polymerase Y family protein [Rhodoferax sp. GW822-FHT02A01]|uniref:Y-family DNA polymerase n=1 Tax=Rhodoferax sp. GW822-FHT02A01 TaxID=3141537 RepID=UPI00315DE30E